MDIENKLLTLEKDVLTLTQNQNSYSNTIVSALQTTLNQINTLNAEVDSLKHNQNLIMNNDFMHISTYQYGNIGDRILCDMIKRTICSIYSRNIEWADISVGCPFRLKEARYANAGKALVVGGGGLFFERADEQSGSWQWDISDDAIDRLDVPVFIFAVGYNQFRGQGELSESFKENINRLAPHCGFIGLRNHGSIDAISKYLLPEYRDKLVWQPCPTTIISRICPEYTNENPEEDFIAVNLAFDKAEFRFSKNGADIYQERMLDILKVLNVLQGKIKIKYYSHFGADNEILQYLDQAGIRYELVDLFTEKDIDKIYQAYAAPKMVIGMRGHAQMIPFGLRVPILSIISHDKLQWFLDDIEHPEWGVDIRDDNFAVQLYEKACVILDNHDAIRKEISRIQDKLFDVTMTNIEYMEKITE